MASKWQQWKGRTIKGTSPEMQALACRRKPITDAMYESLDSLRLSDDPGDVERAVRGQGIDPAHLRYAVSVIANGDHDGVTMDQFGWRVHSIVTHTTSEIRPFLTFGNASLTELDVRNAQPLLLAAAIRNPAICATYASLSRHIGVVVAPGLLPAPLLLVQLFRDIPSAEAEDFARICSAGMFYESVAGGDITTNRDRIKKSACLLFFGKRIYPGPVPEAFRALWPNIFDAIQAAKVAFGYKIVAQVLQRMESTIIIDGVCGRIVTELPGVRFLTIHDAALVVAGQAVKIGQFIEAEFQRYGVRATVRQENLAEKRADT